PKARSGLLPEIPSVQPAPAAARATLFPDSSEKTQTQGQAQPQSAIRGPIPHADQKATRADRERDAVRRCSGFARLPASTRRLPVQIPFLPCRRVLENHG